MRLHNVRYILINNMYLAYMDRHAGGRLYGKIRSCHAYVNRMYSTVYENNKMLV